MKKILSTLVMCLILGVGSVWAVDNTLKVTVKAAINSTPVHQDGEITAQVCVNETQDGEVIQNCSNSKEYELEASMDVPADNKVEIKFIPSFEIIGDESSKHEAKTLEVYGSCILSSECPEEGYVFSHWEATGATIVSNGLGAIGTCEYKIEMKYGDLFDVRAGDYYKVGRWEYWIPYIVTPKKNVAKNITFTAVWVQPHVTGVDNDNYTLQTITDITEWREQSVVFRVENDLSKKNFSCSLTGSGFSFKNTSLNAGADTYTAIVAYTPTGIHGSHTGTVTLTSNYPSVDPTYATSNLTVEENYYPAFKLPNIYAVSTQAQPTYVGAYTQLMETNIVPTELNYAARTILPLNAEKINGAVWKVELPESENPSRFFSLELIGSTQVVRFTPKGTVDPNIPYTARLDVTCTYYDAEGKPLTTTKSVTLSAYAKNDASARLEIEGVDTYNLDFGDVIYGTPYTQTVSYVAINIATPIEEWNTTSNEITYTNYGSMIAVHLSKDLTMEDHSASLVYKSGDKTAILNIFANVVLGTPELTAHAGLSQVTLTWTPVYGAGKYIIMRGGSTLKEITDPTITSYVDENLTNGSGYSYTVTAVYSADEKINTTSNEATATPNVPETITVEDLPYLGLYTGTNDFKQDHPIYGTFPYSEKRLIDLSKTFDIYGRPLFDELYIFGLTTETDGTHDNIYLPSASLGCNAATPLYVYTKSGNKYDKTAEYDAVKKRFDHGTSKNGKHLYFTGYCPFAYMGVNASEEGWMYFKDDRSVNEKTVDIYLDNCEIMGRYKTPTGKNADYNSYTLELTADVGTIGGNEPNNSFIFGASSPFIFTSARTSSSEPYQPTIHIAGQNHLQGQQGSYITKTVGHVQIAGSTITTIDAGINGIHTYSSPITIKPIELNTFTDLVMTDIWKDNTITNGYLILDSDKGGSPSEKVVAIDLGSKNGSLTINGGQYHLRNSAADGTYACNLAIGYRRFSKLVEKDAPIIGAVKVLLHLYGFGGDVADCKVIINSGTFTMYKNMYMNGSTPLGAGYYKDQENFLDLRLPAGDGKSRINGGTFNGISNVLMCTKVTTTGASPKNGFGDWLCLQDVVVTGEKTSYGSDQFEIPAPFNDYTDPQVLYDLLSPENKDDVSGGLMYGGQSANSYPKEDKQIVRLLLPGTLCGEGNCVDCEYQKEAIIFQWATAIPRFDATKVVDSKEESISVGGEIKVEETPVGEEAEYQTNQLLFMDCAGMENYSMDLVAQGAKLSFNDTDMPRGQVVNENDYWILKHLNILKSVQADTWYTFTAPFDVHDISVIETNEKDIDVPGRKRSAALQLQAQDNLEILYNLQDFIIPNEQGRASSLTLESLLGTKRQTLVHYDGTNVMSANYYLYELENEVFSTTGTGKNLAITWQPVKRDDGKPLMYQGKTYAIQFPWCPMCNDLTYRDYYDYWSNKMILFHGKGPQEISGVNSQSAIISGGNTILKSAIDSYPDEFANGAATLAGNSTLADMTLEANSAYVHNMANDYFEPKNTSYTLKPMEGFMLYTPNDGAQMPARISRSGQIEYDENVETGVGGVPTVGDRTSLMLYGAYDGFELLSLCEQLVTVYNLQGNIIFQQYMTAGEQVYVGTGAGVFIVRGESETIKVMVE